MNIAIFHNTKKEQSTQIAKEIANFLKDRAITVIAEDEEASLIGAKSLSFFPHESIDFSISLGGDGTILRLVHHHPYLQVPILAINLGSLGFMADITVNEIKESLEHLINGNYKIESRLVIEGNSTSAYSNFAVNDIVIHRGGNPSLIDLKIYVDDRYLNTFSADGIILSTPTGSTAYSLAAGGPILTPELNALVLTPISPHTISNRPIVLMPEKEIRIDYTKGRIPIDIIYDGFPSTLMNLMESLIVTRSKRVFNLVSIPGHDYFETLRNKLGWTGKLRF